MRKEFFAILEKMMKRDKRVIFLTGDLGYSYMEKVQGLFPARFINVGCMEQSMIGIAVGLSRAGWKPYVYSDSTFLLGRALEQVRNDIVQENNKVKLFGVAHSGFLGYSHNLLHDKEDVNTCKNIGLPCYTPKTQKSLEFIMNDNKNNSYYARI